MPVTFTVASHAANPVKASYKPTSNAEDLLASTWGRKAKIVRSKELLQTSLSSGGAEKQDWSSVHPRSNGFVNTVTKAYNEHHHLLLRPDDVWIAILGQFNFYVNAHAEEFRAHFVKHEGKKELVVAAVGTRYTVDFGNLAKQMTQKIDENVVDKDLKNWILPDFSTTSANDTVICAVLMMSTLKAYFDYKMMLMCGIPSVTLEGEKSDWESILTRIDKLSTFGAEPSHWASLLKPILSRFVRAFDLVGTTDMLSPGDQKFWNNVCHHHPGGSGPTYLSGWITAFCVWSNEGKWLGPALPGTQKGMRYEEERIEKLTLDGVDYGFIDSSDVPTGFCEVDVKLDDNGVELECMMVSGHVASKVEGKGKDTLRPLPAWFIFVKEECAEDTTARFR